MTYEIVFYIKDDDMPEYGVLFHVFLYGVDDPEAARTFVSYLPYLSRSVAERAHEFEWLEKSDDFMIYGTPDGEYRIEASRI